MTTTLSLDQELDGVTDLNRWDRHALVATLDTTIGLRELGSRIAVLLEHEGDGIEPRAMLGNVVTLMERILGLWRECPICDRTAPGDTWWQVDHEDGCPLDGPCQEWGDLRDDMVRQSLL